MTTTTTVQKLAGELSAALTWDERTNGDKFVKLTVGSPEWMTDVIHKAHGDKMPDDHVYWFCEMAADAISECDEDADDDTMREAIQEIEPPCYTHDQMKWFAQNWEYCDQAIEEGLWTSGTLDHSRRGERYNQVIDLVAIGMQLHIQEIGYALLQALTDRAEELDNE